MLNAYPNHPPSPFRLPPSRAALTLAEVLIAMGLMTLGLLGVAAVFPVGGFYMQSGDIADRGGAIAQAALEDAIIQGHLDPKNWIVHDITRTTANAGAFMELVSGRSPINGSPTRKLTGLKQSTSTTSSAAVLGVTKPTSSAVRAAMFGGAYVIDPVGLMNALDDSATNNTITANMFNSAAFRRFPAFAGMSEVSNPFWNHWQANSMLWPVRRVTVFDSMLLMNGSGNSNREFSRALPLSRKSFSGEDDLSLSLPDEGDVPSQQLWEQANGLPVSRLSQGDYSWVISVCPETSVNRDTWASAPDAHPVEVSAVVFHKRVLTKGIASTLQTERLVKARVISSSATGGELLLERRTGGASFGAPPSDYTREPTTSPFENLRIGQFLMLTGPHPLSSESQPRLVLNWYRVLSIEKEGRPNLNGEAVQLGVTNAIERVLVSLRGPDWPWQPAGTGLNDPTSALLPNDLRVGILPGVVAVHTKTMRLESATEWSIR